MYKVFFKDRTVFFSEDFSGTFRTKSGLFYKYESRENLAEIIGAFFHLNKINNLFLFHKDLDFLRGEFSSLFNIISASGGLVRNPAGEVLVIKRNGIWDLPKGKKEKGESSDETALREVSEECGIDPPVISKFLTKTWHAYKIDGKSVLKETDWYEMKVNDGISTCPQEAENITEIKWIRPENSGSIRSNTYPLILDVLASAGIQ
jgi:8-oxo-dGTP pyrophosphatase MutT (NUDIX family)